LGARELPLLLRPWRPLVSLVLGLAVAVAPAAVQTPSLLPCFCFWLLSRPVMLLLRGSGQKLLLLLQKLERELLCLWPCTKFAKALRDPRWPVQARTLPLQ